MCDSVKCNTYSIKHIVYVQTQMLMQKIIGLCAVNYQEQEAQM